MSKVDLALEEMITIAQSRLERLRDNRSGFTQPIENGRILRRIYDVLAEIQDRLTPSNEANKKTFLDELNRYD
jgi:hypothetical protein